MAEGGRPDRRDGDPPLDYVRVTVRKDTGKWTTYKYRGDTLVCMASGPDFRTAMLQTTMVGRDPDAPESDLGAMM